MVTRQPSRADGRGDSQTLGDPVKACRVGPLLCFPTVGHFQGLSGKGALL